MATSNTDYKKEWFNKAEIDYFSPFVNLWLACNSWYNFHYGLKTDRDNINKLKNELTPSNKIYQRFKTIYSNGVSKDEKNFLSILEQLHFSLVNAQLLPIGHPAGMLLGFEHLLVDITKKANIADYKNAILKNPLKKNGQFKNGINGVILSNQLVFTDDHTVIFPGIVEVLYQVRCMLIHGQLPPNKFNHEVVKYCYLLLYEMLKEFCGPQ